MLPELKDLLRKNPAFKTSSKLEILAEKYNIKIIYLPKFHCELSPIEGLWAYEKQFVRKYNKQTNFNDFKNLFVESRNSVIERNLVAKLWRRFLRTISAYKLGLSYDEILKLYFGSRSKENIQEHRRITSTIKVIKFLIVHSFKTL